ncbi:xylulokinase [Microvirga sp. 2TAF3]|uniref:xylulokinase n=1 Tax=Microvirga sp. 2TAF3 TaxID=3233014 RepID=UPI003F9E0446
MYLGIDLGTSGVKAVLIDEKGALVGEGTAPLTLARPRPLWSEQDPEAWWQATKIAVSALGARHSLDAVAGIGLSGQMHGAVLLGRSGQVLRPAILWNDGRAGAACIELERREPASRTITGNMAMPGFTAPKLIWVAQHEPDVFTRTARVLLPKDWIRFRLTGEAVSEPSDAAGTLWLDVKRRRWSPAMLAATDLEERHMPRLVEGTQVSGQLSRKAADTLGLRPGIPVAGGGGDNAAGAVGIGVVRPGMAFLSLGTSGVIFVADDVLKTDPDRAVHALCHCIPDMWHRMAVILSAASTLSFATRLVGATDEAELLAEIEAAGVQAQAHSRLVVLPYLSGERTPHNDPTATGVIFGLDGATNRVDLGRAVLEGVAFALADGLHTLEAGGGPIKALSVIGGGARSKLWGRILAAALERPLMYHHGGEVGPALGAARLARIAVSGASLDEACPPPPLAHVIEPEPALVEMLEPRRILFRRLYRDLRSTFASSVC